MNDLKITALPNTNKHIVAFIAMLLGPILVFGMVLVMNRMEFGTNRELLSEVSEVAFVKSEPPKPNSPIKKTTEKPKPKVSRPTRTTAPIPQLNSGLSGLNFGLDLAGIDNGKIGSQLNPSDTQSNNKNVATSETTADTLPQPKLKSPFSYPKAAKSNGVTGYVVLSVLVEVDGSVDKVEVVESSPTGVFDDSALSGIKNWRFSPGLNQGKPVKVWVKQKIRFSLG